MNAGPAGTEPIADVCALAVARKFGSVPRGPLAGTYARAFRDWLGTVTSARYAGLVLDYDGTVCATGTGHAPPVPAVRAELLRLLGSGAVVGFASGRGRTLHRELRGWVPKLRWPHVVAGMYNGGVRRALTDDVPHSEEIPRPDVSRQAAAALAEAVTRLSAFRAMIWLDVRIGQVTVNPRDENMPHGKLVALTRSVVTRPPAPAVSVLESARAVDIVPAGVTKIAVLAEVAKLAAGPVLAIGDQGQFGGNDFALLACQPHTLSVDRCSADPTRCWNLAGSGVSGPDALLGYLAALRPHGTGLLSFCPPHAMVCPL